MTKYQRLKGRIIEKYGTQGAFADVVGMTEQSISRKMNGDRGFDKDDILKWSELLDINRNEIGTYFF